MSTHSPCSQISKKIQSKNSVYGAMRSGLEFSLLFPPPPLIPPFSWWHLCFIAANSHYRRPEKKTEGKKQKVLFEKVNTLFSENSECCSQFLIPMIAALGKVFLFTDTPMGLINKDFKRLIRFANCSVDLLFKRRKGKLGAAAPRHETKPTFFCSSTYKEGEKG